MVERGAGARLYEPRHERAEPAEVRALQLQRLRELLAHTWERNDFYREHWRAAGVRLDAIDSLEAFAARVPMVGKADFLADQQAEPPYGRRARHALASGEPLFVCTTSGTSGQGQEVHVQTPAELDAMGHVYSHGYCWAGLERGDGLLLALPLTMLGGGRLEYHGALTYGLGVFPVGNYEAERKLATLARFKPAGVIGITAYLGRLARAIEEGEAPPRCVITGGEGAGIEWLLRLQDAWGAPVFDRYGSSQAGSDHMFSCEHGIGTPERPGTLHNVDPYVLTEVIDPRTGAHVADGEAGELVVTVLYRHDAPIIRCRMGDRGVYRAPGSCPCGRPFMGLETCSIGRVDDMRKIKGVNVWPQAIDDTVFAHAGVSDYQVTLRSGAHGQDVATLRVLPGEGLSDEAVARLARELSDDAEARIGIRFEVEAVADGGLDVGEWKARRWLDEREHVQGAPRGLTTKEDERA